MFSLFWWFPTEIELSVAWYPNLRLHQLRHTSCSCVTQSLISLHCISSWSKLDYALNVFSVSFQTACAAAQVGKFYRSINTAHCHSRLDSGPEMKALKGLKGPMNMYKTMPSGMSAHLALQRQMLTVQKWPCWPFSMFSNVVAWIQMRSVPLSFDVALPTYA